MRTDIYNRRKHKKNRNDILCMFWDFYALYEMWFRLGGGTERYYGYTGKIVPFKREQKIISCYYDNIYEFFPLLYDALERSCRCEIRHFFMQDYFDYKYVNEKNKNYIRKLIKTKSKWSISIQDMHKVFLEKEAWFERSYGGKRWARGTNLLLELQEKKKVFNENWGFYIDRILDLRHNTGVMLNKTEFECITPYQLNKRANIKHVKEYLEDCPLSKKVSGLLKTSLIYL